MLSSYSRNSSSGTERLSQDIAKLVNDRYGSDVQFMVGGVTDKTNKSLGETIYDASAAVTIYAHSAILRCRSRHFAAMFENDKEWRKRSDGVIHKPNISLTVFYKVLEYIYTGDAHIETDTLLELIAAAEDMELDELSTKCQVTVMQILEHAFSKNERRSIISNYEKEKGELHYQNLSMESAIRIFLLPALTLAHSHTLTGFFRRLFDFTVSNINTILTSPDILSTFYEEIPIPIFRQILSSDALDMPECKVWEFAFSLACHKAKVLESAVEAHFRLESSSNLDGDFETETEFEEVTSDYDGYEYQPVLSEEELKQLKVNLTPLLPAIRFSLMDGDQYSRIVEVLGYFLPSRRLHGLNRFYAQSEKTLPLDTPRLNRSHELNSNTKELEEVLQTFSNIVDKVELWQQMKTWVSESNEIQECYSAKDVKLSLLFRASEHDFSGEAFHRHCDNKGPTLIIAKSDDGHLFGGVNFVHWESNNTYSGTTSNFLFALADGHHRKISSNFLYSNNGGKLYAVYNNPYRGPIFGNGSCDLYIPDKANILKSSSYMPKLYNGVGASNCALAGKGEFLVAEYEVFAISKS